MPEEEDKHVASTVEHSNNTASDEPVSINKYAGNGRLTDADTEMECDEIAEKENDVTSKVDTLESATVGGESTTVNKERISSGDVEKTENVISESVKDESLPVPDKDVEEKSDNRKLDTAKKQQNDKTLESNSGDADPKPESSGNSSIKSIDKETADGDALERKDIDIKKNSTDGNSMVVDESINTMEVDRTDVSSSNMIDRKDINDRLDQNAETGDDKENFGKPECIENSNKEECMEIENISEDSSSIQEALITAHALLDSLSPMKPQSEPEVFPGCRSSHSPKCKTDLGTSLGVKDSAHTVKVSHAVEKPSGVTDHSESPKEISSEGKKPSGETPTSAGSLTKTSSYGFTVSDILSDDKEKDSKDADDGIPVLKEQSVHSGTVLVKDFTLGEQNADDIVNSKTVEVTESANIGSSASKGIFIDSSTSSQESNSALQITTVCSQTPVFVHGSTTGLVTSVSEPGGSQQLNLSATSSDAHKDLCEKTVASVQTGTSYEGQSEGIPCVSSGTSLTLTGSYITTSINSNLSFPTVTQPVVSITSPAVKTPMSVSEHGYSRAYTEMPLGQSALRKSPFPTMMGARSPGGTIVLQDSQSSASYIEVPLDLDDKSPSSRKAMKRKRPSLATEDILNYGKRRSARVSTRAFIPVHLESQIFLHTM